MAVLIISCDKYQDIWEPFFQLFFRSWPSCAYRIYLGTNELDYSDRRVTVVKAGRDKSWSESVKKMIEQVEEPLILTILEDSLFTGPTNSALIASALSVVQGQDISCYRLQSHSMPRMKRSRKILGQDSLYRILPEDEYCVDTGIAIWKKEILRDLLREGHSACDFEVQNSSRCRTEQRLPGVFVTTGRPQLSIRQAVIQGKWVPSTVKFCQRHGIALDMSRRREMTFREVLWEFSKHSGREFLPPTIRHVLKKLMFKFGQGRRFASPY